MSSDSRYEIAGGIIAAIRHNLITHKCSQRNYQVTRIRLGCLSGIGILVFVLLWIIFNLSWNVRRPLPW